MQCPQCGGPMLYLGTLGNYEHSTCRNCGWEESVRVMASDDSYYTEFDDSVDRYDEDYYWDRDPYDDYPG